MSSNRRVCSPSSARTPTETRWRSTAAASARPSVAGHEVDTQGDSLFFAFARADEAVAAAAAGQHALAGLPVRVRMGLHTGQPSIMGDNYVGLDVHRAARICAAAHGGQIVLSQTTQNLADVRRARPRRASPQGPRRSRNGSTSSSQQEWRRSSRRSGRSRTGRRTFLRRRLRWSAALQSSTRSRRCSPTRTSASSR